MKSKKKVPRKAGREKAKTSALRRLLASDGPITPRPAFKAFTLEDEWHGRRRLRSLGKFLEDAKFAPNACHEASSVYSEAWGSISRDKWFCCYNPAGKMVYKEKWVAPTEEEAARDLYAIAQNATMFLWMLLDAKPELCRRIAASKSGWPVMADLTEKDWKQPIAETISKLELGKDIKGYLLSARTADENVIRCWATAIYETLFETRCAFKRAANGSDKYSTADGCPDWARKTLDLPPFTKSDSRKWAKLGEEMLLQQKPGFLDSPDLAAKKRSWTRRAQKDSRSGSVSLRAIHREAFEDFAKELKNIAPERVVWQGDW